MSHVIAKLAGYPFQIRAGTLRGAPVVSEDRVVTGVSADAVLCGPAAPVESGLVTIESAWVGRVLPQERDHNMRVERD